METKGWSLKEKIGQMFIIAFGGEEMTRELEMAITELNVGGVILFQRNLRDFEKVIQLNKDIQRVARKHGRPPLWISIDQEGGGIAYLWKGMTLSPGNMLIGAAQHTQNAYDASYIMGLQLKKLGFNMNFAPNIDVNNNPKNPVIGARSYGESPEKVSELGRESVRGYHDSGVLAVGKHFPGHGDTALDSHLSLPKVEKDLEELEQFELLPFLDCMNDGMEAIMTAHILYPLLDPENPATLSSYFLKDLLRTKYRFDGLIITDSMEMQAISKFFGREAGTVKAVKAGADIILACGKDVESQHKMMEAVEHAVNEGTLDEAVVDLAVNRILTSKEKWIKDTAESNVDLAYFQQHDFQDKMYQIALEGITLQIDRAPLLPLPVNETISIISQKSYNDENYTGDRQSIVHKLFNKDKYEVSYLAGANPDSREILELPTTVNHNQYVVLMINERRELSETWVNLILALKKKTKNIIVVSLWNPQIIEYLPVDLSTYITTFSYTDQVMKGLKNLLEGDQPFKGTSPVTLLESRVKS